MEVRPFGRTGLQVSVIGFGCWEIGGGYGQIEEAEFARAVSRALDRGEYGVRVNCVAPGLIATPMTNYDLARVRQTSQPLNREGAVKDVAEAVLFLASDRSAQITGRVLPVDGGFTAGRPMMNR